MRGAQLKASGDVLGAAGQKQQKREEAEEGSQEKAGRAQMLQRIYNQVQGKGRHLWGSCWAKEELPNQKAV